VFGSAPRYHERSLSVVFNSKKCLDPEPAIAASVDLLLASELAYTSILATRLFHQVRHLLSTRGLFLLSHTVRRTVMFNEQGDIVFEPHDSALNVLLECCHQVDDSGTNETKKRKTETTETQLRANLHWRLLGEWSPSMLRDPLIPITRSDDVSTSRLETPIDHPPTEPIRLYAFAFSPSLLSQLPLPRNMSNVFS